MSQKLLDEAETILKSDPKRAEQLFREILDQPEKEGDSALLRDQESALVHLGKLCRDRQDAPGLSQVITLSRSFMSSSAKAKTAKLIRTLLDLFSSIPNSNKVQTDVLQENIDWASQNHRVFLRQSLEIRLAALQLSNQSYKPALQLVDSLLVELRRLDDKLLLTEVHLLESKIYRGVGNFPKSKAALTSAKTAANSIYCPPHLQSQLDLQSGILHAEDKDYKTAYSYFFETFENQSNQGDDAALESFKYMLLCKIMLNSPEDVTSLMSIKLALKYAQLRDVESMRAVARAHQNRNLGDFERALKEYHKELYSNTIISSHLAALYDTLLEQHLLRIVEPYSVVEISYVAKLVGQQQQVVESKLSQMILDKVLNGVLDQGRSCLILYGGAEKDGTYASAIEMLTQVGNVVDSLYAKATKVA